MILGAVCILKDEAETLADLFATLEGARFDEVILGVDSKSSDATLEMCRRFKAIHQDIAVTVYEFTIDPWSFAKARNTGLDRAQATFLVYLEGHERIFYRQWPAVRDTIEKVMAIGDGDDAPDLIQAMTLCGYSENQAITDSVPHERCWRNKPAIRYTRNVHNILDGHNRRIVTIEPTRWCVEHVRPLAQDAERQEQRNAMIPVEVGAELKIELEKEARGERCNVNRPLYYLGNHWLTQEKDPEKAAAFYVEFLKRPSRNTHEDVSVHCLLGACLMQQAKGKEGDEAIELRNMARRQWIAATAKIPTRAEGWVELGESYMHRAWPEFDTDLALFYLQVATLCKYPRNAGVSLDRRKYEYWPFIRIAEIYAEVGIVDHAIDVLERARKFPDGVDVVEPTLRDLRAKLAEHPDMTYDSRVALLAGA